MFGARVSDYPNSSFRAQGGKVGNDFSQVAVVTFLKLVLNHHGIPGGILGHEVHVKVASRLLALYAT